MLMMKAATFHPRRQQGSPLAAAAALQQRLQASHIWITLKASLKIDGGMQPQPVMFIMALRAVQKAGWQWPETARLPLLARSRSPWASWLAG
jgi:hypothetical protein